MGDYKQFNVAKGICQRGGILTGKTIGGDSGSLWGSSYDLLRTWIDLIGN